MKAYHLQWNYEDSDADPQTGEQIQIRVPIDSYAFVEGNYTLEFDFSNGGEKVMIWANNSEQADKIIRNFEKIKGALIDENTKHYCIECLFERDYEIK
jgi:hypothetical protein